MGFLDNFLDKIGLAEDEEYYDDDIYDDFEDDRSRASAKPAQKSSPRSVDAEERTSANRASTVKPATKVTPIGGRAQKRPASSMEVCVKKPTSVEDSREVTEALLNGTAVILNLEGLDLDVAQRIIDFSSGSCFALSGNLQKISNYIFIITPQNVDIFGDFQDILNGKINVNTLRDNL